jgi:DivIVA domain-containing protein
MPLTPDDVQNKRFSTVRFKEGYDEEEVDAFLDEVEAELRRLLSENQSLDRAGAASAAQEVAPSPAATPAEEPNEAALRTLLLAQRTADEAIAQAKGEADQIVAQAKVRASSIETEAQQQHASAMAELQRQRGSLESQIEELRTFEREYRTRLKAYLEGQLRDLERSTAAPAGPSAGRPATPPPPPPPGPAAPPPAAADVPRLAPTRPAAPGVAPPAAPPSPFTAAPPLVEDVDAGSDAPGGPPREPVEDGTDEQA